MTAYHKFTHPITRTAFAFNLIDMQTAFIILGIGLAISLIVFQIEFFILRNLD